MNRVGKYLGRKRVTPGLKGRDRDIRKYVYLRRIMRVVLGHVNCVFRLLRTIVGLYVRLYVDKGEYVRGLVFDGIVEGDVKGSTCSRGEGRYTRRGHAWGPILGVKGMWS